MKINEITQAKVTKTLGNKIEVDHGDGTSTTVDTQKNPTAIARDPATGKLKLNTKPKNSAMGSSQTKNSAPKPGEKIELDDET